MNENKNRFCKLENYYTVCERITNIFIEQYKLSDYELDNNAAKRQKIYNHQIKEILNDKLHKATKKEISKKDYQIITNKLTAAFEMNEEKIIHTELDIKVIRTYKFNFKDENARSKYFENKELLLKLYDQRNNTLI